MQTAVEGLNGAIPAAVPWWEGWMETSDNVGCGRGKNSDLKLVET